MSDTSFHTARQHSSGDDALALAFHAKRTRLPEAVCRFHGSWDIGRCTLESRDFSENRGRVVAGYRVSATGSTQAAALLAAVSLVERLKIGKEAHHG
jgi:hypothetical protein